MESSYTWTLSLSSVACNDRRVFTLKNRELSSGSCRKRFGSLLDKMRTEDLKYSRTSSPYMVGNLFWKWLKWNTKHNKNYNVIDNMEMVVFITGDLEEMRPLSGLELVHQRETLQGFVKSQLQNFISIFERLNVEDISCFHVVSSSFSSPWMTAL